MTSRRILWALLGFAALPAVLEGTTGCTFDSPSASTGPVMHNAVECACTFGGDGARTLRIQAGPDDAEQDGLGAAVDLANGDLDLGDKYVGLRFDGIAIPPGAMILSAHVQFTADETQSGDTSTKLVGEASIAAAPFTTNVDDISGRVAGTKAVNWTIPPWTNNSAGPAERTPDFATLLQELVDLPMWAANSAVVLRFDEGTGHRTAESFEDAPDQAPALVVSYTANVTANIPACATGAPLDANGYLADPAAECSRVAATLGGLNEACGLPVAPTCTVIDRKNPNGSNAPDSFQAEVCETSCTGNEVDAPTCSEYDPIAFASCVASGMPLDSCKQMFASATHAGSDEPVCVASGSPLAFHAFGRRSRCEVEGESDILIGNREPEQNPDTEGTLEILADCPGGSCNVQPTFILNMDPITFSVRWASDPTFGDLGAAGTGVESAPLASGLSTFAPDTVEGTGTGRRGDDNLAVNAMNPDPVDVGVDWAGRTCDMQGTLSAGVGDDGLCEADGTTPCSADADCAAVGGACILPPDSEEMSVTVALTGTLVNQPPTAAAGPDQTVECTSSAGASFVLNGSGSSDPEPNLALASWRAGSRTGPELSTDLRTQQALGVGGTGSYVLRVIDAFAQLDEDTTNVSVVDTTPPVITCNAPATIVPPEAEISFGATATDVCDDAVAAQVTSYDCFNYTKQGRRVSKLESCIVSFEGNTLTVHDVGGYGDHITWTVEAPDDSGNVGMTTCEVVVAK